VSNEIITCNAALTVAVCVGAMQVRVHSPAPRPCPIKNTRFFRARPRNRRFALSVN
jgi:hypothetical protein